MEHLILERGLITAEQLQEYRVRMAASPHLHLLDLLIEDGVITTELASELHSAASQKPAASRPAGFGPLRHHFAAPAATITPPGLSNTAAGRVNKRRFETSVMPAVSSLTSPPGHVPPAAHVTAASPPPVLIQPPVLVDPQHDAAVARAEVGDGAAVEQSAHGAPMPPGHRRRTVGLHSHGPSHEHEHGHGHGSEIPAHPVETAPVAPEGWPGGIAPEDSAPGGLQEILKQAQAANASDLHLNVGVPAMVRVAGQFVPLHPDGPKLTPADTARIIRRALTPSQWEFFDSTGDFDLAYTFPGGGRYRTNVFRERNGLGLKTRLVSARIPSVEELGLPPQAKRLTEFAQGLVLVTGPSGHGKTTSMMALVQLVNQTRPDHIITVEDPIEYIMAGASCQVSQREIGLHTASFATALKAALRENPDIIVIGDLRDYEATSMAISAAETGHLVFASLPTQNAAKTIDKVLDYFPPEEQAQIRMMVSESLRGILSQQLIPRKDGQGRVAAVELLFNSIAVANIIRDANTSALTNAMQLGKSLGMLLMDESLQALVQAGQIAGEEAWVRASNKALFAQFAPKKA